MAKIDEIYNALRELTLKNKSGISAVDLSDYLKLNRANVSRYLNKLYNMNKVEKIEGRPVLYRVFMNESKKNKEKIEAMNEGNAITKNNITKASNSLDLMVGAGLSLQVPIQQAKAAILYPPRGLHTLILGETGVGKSMFADLMYQFAKESKMINDNGPFIRFNCADYADNPQLVMSQIFGVKKGAYTGADSDREGLLKKAHGGILFLDEIHRLSPQGQEMLFTYIDKGGFRPLGETEKIIKVEVQIIAATTEDTNSYLLKTFTRRIPMTITLPSLRERSLKERYYLLEEFIKSESKRLSKTIYINKNALVSFLLYNCSNNIGQLKSDIQLSCAKAFLNYKTNSRDYILIEQGDLHPGVRNGLMKIQDYRNEVENLLGNKGDVLRFFYGDEKFILETRGDNNNYNNQEHFYDYIENKLDSLKSQGMEEKEINEILNIDIDEFFKNYIKDLPHRIRREELCKIVDSKIVDLVEILLKTGEDRLNRNFEEKVYFGLALHLQGSIERIKQGNKIYHPKLNIIRSQYSDEFMVAMEFASMIDNEFNITVPLDEIGYLTMFLSAKTYDVDVKKVGKVSVLVIMHGNSTASSMVNVVNSLIDEEFAKALDMPLNMKAEEMYELAKRKIQEMYHEKGVLLLVDMGSLTNFGDMISEEIGIEVETVDMVSTPVVLEATRKALIGRDLNSIYESCLDFSRHGIQLSYERSSNKKLLIITACFTGKGASERLKKIIEVNLNKKDIVEIIPLSILDREEFIKQLERYKKTYKIISVVGTVDLSIEDIIFIPMQDILTEDGIRNLRYIVNKEEQYMNIKNSLRDHIDVSNIDELVEDIIKFIKKTEEILNIEVNKEILSGIIMHMCFMVDRIKKGDKETKFINLNEYKLEHGEKFMTIKKIIKNIERKQNINIEEHDLAHLIRMILENN
ncbi:sigma 54-interacting transcriptional regulator [Clostridium sp.]|uniref:sigma 54-interacting transcriptional regulator n=1 Tax=Clostridium sp. TaxID=1506 RepID=UPI003463D741